VWLSVVVFHIDFLTSTHYGRDPKIFKVTLHPNAPTTLSSTEAFTTGTPTHLSLPPGQITQTTLRIEPPSVPEAESKIILQSLFAVLDRKTVSPAPLILVVETDVTTSFARAALTEFAQGQNLSLDEIEIRTPTASAAENTTYSPDGSIDWCRIGEEEEEEATDDLTSPTTTSLLSKTLSYFKSPASSLSEETCTMQLLTLLSELTRLQKCHATFLILKPTRYDRQNGRVAGVKIPFVSEGMGGRFERMGRKRASRSSSSSFAAWAGAPSPTAETSVDPPIVPIEPPSHGGPKGRAFREAVIAAVAPFFVHEEEFEKFVVLEDGNVRVRCRCVPLFDGEGMVGEWVCFLGGEMDVVY
jgi:hypothetical protein